MSHPILKELLFVGSTSVGKSIFILKAAGGERVQALCEAKNHASCVLEDAPVERTAAGIINASFWLCRRTLYGHPPVVVEPGKYCR